MKEFSKDVTFYITKRRGKHRKKRMRLIVENPKVIPDLPGKASVRHFKLMTGHDCPAQHPHEIGFRSSANVSLSSLNSLMNADNLTSFTYAALKLNDIVEKYWDATRETARHEVLDY